MFELIIYGIIFGIILSFSLGPIFFKLIETSIEKGFLSAFMMDLGALLTDILYLLVAYFSAKQIQDVLEGNLLFQRIGGAVFILFGVYSIYSKYSSYKKNKLIIAKLELREDSEELINQLTQGSSYLGSFIKGFAINAINPAVLIFWITTCTVTISRFNIDSSQKSMTFFGTIITSFFIADVTKIYFASKLKSYVTPKSMYIIGVIVGAIMIMFGLIFLFSDPVL